jgi:hypothetical protein
VALGALAARPWCRNQLTVV